MFLSHLEDKNIQKNVKISWKSNLIMIDTLKVLNKNRKILQI